MLSASTSEAIPPILPGQSILVVEDSDDMGSLIASVLEDEGFQVRRARTGAEALRQARLVRPDLITLDVGLPDASGLDVVRGLRTDPATATIPVIAVSAQKVDPNGELQTLVARVLSKPFYVHDLVTAITDLVHGTARPDHGEA